MEKHDAKGYFAPNKHFFKCTKSVRWSSSHTLAFTEVAFTRMNSTPINVDALTI